MSIIYGQPGCDGTPWSVPHLKKHRGGGTKRRVNIIFTKEQNRNYLCREKELLCVKADME